jgi:hypothetical protein
MPLFVAQHRHPPEACPAAGATGPLLLQHVSAANAARYGVSIQAEAILVGEHRLLLVLEAANHEHVERFMAFFERFGSVEILPALSSESAITHGACCAASRRTD